MLNLFTFRRPSFSLGNHLYLSVSRFLLLLCIAHCTALASISYPSSFPQDVFAKPAFNLDLGSIQPQTNLAPIRNSTAIAILERQSQGQRVSVHDLVHHKSTKSSLTIPSSEPNQPHQQFFSDPKPLLWNLYRTSPSTAHLCAISDFTSDRSKQSFDSSSSHSQRSKKALVQRAIELLEPLKQVCLFHTIDWFTYSFCHGRQVRQFRQLTASSAAAAAKEEAGEGEKGEEAANRAAKAVAMSKIPLADPRNPSFTLGRWKPESEWINDADSDSAPPALDQSALEHNQGGRYHASHHSVTLSDVRGTELIEEVRFDDWDEEELFHTESDVPDGSNSEASSSSESRAPNHDFSVNRSRYISQIWTDGTLCDINNMPRSIEIQFHCSLQKPEADRIVMFKETVTCNYALVIETPRLCAEPAFRGGHEEQLQSIRCHQVVTDDYAGIALEDQVDHPINSVETGPAYSANHNSDPSTDAAATDETTQQGSRDQPHSFPSESQHQRDHQQQLRDLQSGQQNRRSDLDGSLGQSESETNHAEDPSFNPSSGSSNKQDASAGAEYGSTHTYGDLSQYDSIHDDYFDPAVGQHALSNDETDLLYGKSNEASLLSDSDAVLFVGLDEDGRFVIDMLDEFEAGNLKNSLLGGGVFDRDPTTEAAEEEGKDEKASDNENQPQQQQQESTLTRRKKGKSLRDHLADTDDDDIIDLRLDIEDLGDLGDLRGGDLVDILSKALEEKLNTIKDSKSKSKLPSQQQQQQQQGRKREETKGQEKFKNLYDQIIKAFEEDDKSTSSQNSDSNSETRQQRQQQKQAKNEWDSIRKAAYQASIAGGQPNRPRMEKVGDSLSERVKRFYDQKKRNSAATSSNSKKKSTDPPPIHVEL